MVAERLPGPTGPIGAVKTAGDLIKEESGLVFTQGQDPAEVDQVVGILRQFSRRPPCQLQMRVGGVVG